MIFGILRAEGKRRPKSTLGGPWKIYGLRFMPDVRTRLSDAFIQEAGLDNEATFKAAAMSLRTDYGLRIEYRGMAPWGKSFQDSFTEYVAHPNDFGELRPIAAVKPKARKAKKVEIDDGGTEE